MLPSLSLLPPRASTSQEKRAEREAAEQDRTERDRAYERQRDLERERDWGEGRSRRASSALTGGGEAGEGRKRVGEEGESGERAKKARLDEETGQEGGDVAMRVRSLSLLSRLARRSSSPLSDFASSC